MLFFFGFPIKVAQFVYLQYKLKLIGIPLSKFRIQIFRFFWLKILIWRRDLNLLRKFEKADALILEDVKII